MCLKTAEWVENSVDPDQMPHSVASDLGLHCLLRSVCPTTKDKYGDLDSLLILLFLIPKHMLFTNHCNLKEHAQKMSWYKKNSEYPIYLES